MIHWLGYLVEALLEGHREQEAEEHLHAGHRDAHLLQQLHELAVQALLLVLVWIALVVLRPPNGSRRATMHYPAQARAVT